MSSQRVETAPVHADGPHGPAVDQHAHRAAAAEHEVHVACREPEPQTRAGAGHDVLAVHAPAARVGELVLLQLAVGEVVRRDAVRRDRLVREPREAVVAEVRLGRRARLRSRVGELVRDREHPRVLAEQSADPRLGRVVLALAEVDVAQVAAPVDQVLRRPVLVLERVPGLVVVVERDRVRDPQSAHGSADVGRHVLERELGRVHAEDDEPVLVVRPVPGLHVRERPQAVDARVRPEVDEDDLSAQLPERQRLAVDPVWRGRRARAPRPGRGASCRTRRASSRGASGARFVRGRSARPSSAATPCSRGARSGSDGRR